MKKELTYQLTPKGIINLETNDLEVTTAIMESLELYGLRQKCNALLIKPTGWEFINIQKEK